MIENNRMLATVLSTAEFSFVLVYFPGCRNALADFGSRFIDPSEWKKVDSDDPTGIHDLFCLNAEAVTAFPEFDISDLSAADHEELNQDYISVSAIDNLMWVEVKDGQYLKYVPQKFRRSVFWHFHFPRHQGVTELVSQIKEEGYYWPRLTQSLLQFLEQCECAAKKENKSKPYFKKKSITAEYPLHIFGN